MFFNAHGIRVRAASDAGRNRPRPVLHPADRRLLRPSEHRLRRLFPRRVGLQAPRRVRHAEGDAGRRRRTAEGQREVPDDDLDRRSETKEEVGPLAKLQTMWRALPVPKRDQPDLARDGANRMRDFVVRMRQRHGARVRQPDGQGTERPHAAAHELEAPRVATHRRDFDRAALRVEGEAPPVEPKIPLGRDGKPVGYGLVGVGPNGEDLTALKAQVRAYASRMENADLVVPAGQRARYEAAFAKFSSVFPDAFYVRERGRFYPDDSEDTGPAAERGLPQRDGLHPRRSAAQRADSRRER